MTTATAAIANHLNIAEDIITEVQEWVHVLFVRFVGRRPRFVSKKVVEDKAMTQGQLVEKMEEIGGSRWTKGDHDRMYFHGSLVAKLLKLSNSKARQINAAKFYYDLNSSIFVQGCNTKCWDVTDKKFGHSQPYWVEAISAAVGL
jgi:hypothetical protein